MGKTFRQAKLDEMNFKNIEFERKRLMSIGITDPRLLTPNRVMKFMAEKSKRNNKIIPTEEILRILQG